jgi:ribosome-binding factor A
MTDNAKVESALLHAAAEFINRESNRRSLITVTKVVMDQRGRAEVYVSVYPDNQAAAALDFLSRMQDDMREYVKKKIKMRSIPHFTFVQDPNIGGVGEAVPVE